MGKQRRAERAAAKHERARQTPPLNVRALTLASVFPDGGRWREVWPGRLLALACGMGLELREEGPGLKLSCTYDSDPAGQERAARQRNLTYAQVLAALRERRWVPAVLEVVLAPGETVGAWPLEQAERVTFFPGEWQLNGWQHWSGRRIGRAHERMYRTGLEAQFADPYITFHLRLAPKIMHPERQRLLGARAVFDPPFGEAT